MYHLSIITNNWIVIAYLSWAAGHVLDMSPQKMTISQAAQYLNVTVDMLRNWERNGLIPHLALSGVCRILKK